MGKATKSLFDKLTGNVSKNVPVAISEQSILDLLAVQGVEMDLSEQIRTSASEFLKNVVLENGLQNDAFGKTA